MAMDLAQLEEASCYQGRELVQKDSSALTSSRTQGQILHLQSFLYSLHIGTQPLEWQSVHSVVCHPRRHTSPSASPKAFGSIAGCRGIADKPPSPLLYDVGEDPGLRGSPIQDQFYDMQHAAF